MHIASNIAFDGKWVTYKFYTKIYKCLVYFRTCCKSMRKEVKGSIRNGELEATILHNIH